MTRFKMLVAVLMMTGGLASIASAGEPGTQGTGVIRKAHRVNKSQVWIASRPGAAPTAIVSKPMGLHTTHEDLIEVRVDTLTTYLDPNADYLRQGGDGLLDENHHIAAAQRLHRSLNAKPARIVRNPRSFHPRGHTRRPMVRPHMIMTKPMMPRPKFKKPMQFKKKIQIPSVPAPPKKQGRLLA